MAEIDPIRPTDDEARRLGRSLIDGASFGAIGVRDPATGAPYVSRIAVIAGPEGHPLTLISRLAHHTGALRADPACSLLLGEPGERGDPLTHPRITLSCRAEFTETGTDGHNALRDFYLQRLPKAKLYVDFPDFAFATLRVSAAALNGGFGKAFHLTPEDLGLA
jgi:putative heme iron utilization protein